MEIEFNGEFVTGKCNLDTTDMVCVPSKPHYNEVDLCLKSDNREGMNVAFCTIATKALSFEEKKKLGYEIERRWNELDRLKQENERLNKVVCDYIKIVSDLDVKSATTRKNGTVYIQLSAKIETLNNIIGLQQFYAKECKQ